MARDRLRRLVPKMVREELGGLAFSGADAAISARLTPLEEQLRLLHEKLDGIARAAGRTLDDIDGLRHQLAQVRASADYEAAWQEDHPLVTVRIATYNRPGPLVTRTLPTVLGQTYDRLEVLVVGDGCEDDTEEQVATLGDARVRFINLPGRGVYPSDPDHRWMVAGVPAMNYGARAAKGTWIAPIDDDDAWEPAHIERLLAHALQGRLEMAYGKLRMTTTTLHDHVIGIFPPVQGHFNWGGAVYLKLLNFFELDSLAWLLDEPADWNLCRRMMAAGVRMGYLDTVVGTLFPSGPARHLNVG